MQTSLGSPPGLARASRGLGSREALLEHRWGLMLLLWAQVSELRGHWHHHRARADPWLRRLG